MSATATDLLSNLAAPLEKGREGWEWVEAPGSYPASTTGAAQSGFYGPGEYSRSPQLPHTRRFARSEFFEQ